MDSYKSSPTRIELENNINIAEKAVTIARQALQEFNAKAENNIYNDLNKANCWVEGLLYKKAEDDCEGSFNCGQYQYTQEFIVDNIKYIGTLTVGYGRHDKTYYFVDEHEYSFKEVK